MKKLIRGNDLAKACMRIHLLIALNLGIPFRCYTVKTYLNNYSIIY